MKFESNTREIYFFYFFIVFFTLFKAPMCSSWIYFVNVIFFAKNKRRKKNKNVGKLTHFNTLRQKIMPSFENLYGGICTTTYGDRDEELTIKFFLYFVHISFFDSQNLFDLCWYLNFYDREIVLVSTNSENIQKI